MGKKRKKQRHEHGSPEMAAPLVGMAAGLLRHAATPQGRDAIAGALRAAADAIGGARRWPGEQAMTPPTPPAPPHAGRAEEPPIPPVPPIPPIPPAAAMAPEVARMVGLAGAALERWAGSLGQQRDGGEPRKPH